MINHGVWFLCLVSGFTQLYECFTMGHQMLVSKFSNKQNVHKCRRRANSQNWKKNGLPTHCEILSTLLRVGTRVSGQLNERMWSEAFLMAFSCSRRLISGQWMKPLTNVVGSLSHGFLVQQKADIRTMDETLDECGRKPFSCITRATGGWYPVKIKPLTNVVRRISNASKVQQKDNIRLSGWIHNECGQIPVSCLTRAIEGRYLVVGVEP
jgi:hypothetical protein